MGKPTLLSLRTASQIRQKQRATGRLLCSAEGSAQTCCQQKSHWVLPPHAHQPRMLPHPCHSLSAIHSVRLQEREHIAAKADLLCWSPLHITAALANLSTI